MKNIASNLLGCDRKSVQLGILKANKDEEGQGRQSKVKISLKWWSGQMTQVGDWGDSY